ncbi:MAG: TetR/AcrR family transcriptional regulator [Anaerolineales bacterium]|jgi:AcrR family transcriptional regulator
MPKVINEDDVFRAVIKLVVARGYDRATTNELAAAANMHQATLFRKYGSKVGLIERAIEHQLSEAPLSTVAYTGDLQADLYAILEAYVQTNDEYGEIMPVLMLEVPRHPELSNVLAAPLANIQGLVDIITRYQQEGLLRKEPPLTSVNALLAPILMDHMLRRLNVGSPMPDIDLQDYVAAFLDGRRTA